MRSTPVRLAAVAFAVTAVVLLNRDAHGAAALGHRTAAASTTVTIAIPALSGFDVSHQPGQKRISSIRVFGAGVETVLIRVAPARGANVLAASVESSPSRIEPGKWQTINVRIAASASRIADRASSEDRTLKKVAYEVWSF